MQVIPIDFLEVLEELDPKTKNAIIKLAKFLGEAVNREDFVELKTEVEKLTISVRDLTSSIKELTENQKKLEDRLIKVEEGLKLTRKEVGGLAHTVGYSLEDRAYKSLPKLLKKDFDIDIEEKLIRTYLELGRGKFIEINIFGKGKQKDKQVVIMGEGKSQLKKDGCR
jgi:hypothetical protein